MDKHQAIYELNSSVVSIKGDIAYDENGNEVVYDNDAVENLIASKAYIDNRQSEYPSYADQFDQIFHEGVDAWKATIQAVKDKYPKPE